MRTSLGWLVAVVSIGSIACTAPELSLCAGQDSTSSSVRIPREGEPGEEMVITGRVLVGRNRLPVANARLLIYHTNAAGRYARDASGYLGAYLCGVLRTDEDGSYRIETIRPGHPPEGQGEHVHFEITMPWGGKYYEAVSFEGDPRLRGMKAGERWEDVRPVSIDADGIQHVERDIWIRY